MKSEEYKNITENLSNFLLKASESLAEVVEGIDKMASSEAVKEFMEFLLNIPDDIKKTQFFSNVEQLQKINLCYEDVIWLIEDFGMTYTEEEWKKHLGNDNNSKLHAYIANVILSNTIGKREKITILLAHIEPLIYDTLNISKVENSTLKQDIRKVTIKENKGMSAEGLGKIYVLAVMHVVFANTDSFTEEIDRRIPFRNHILHNGIVMYSDEEIKTVYELLLELIGILMHVKEKAFVE